ncbi:cbp3 [Hyphodiscus hymeniophilus]|uniref:Cbp3 n=1 Tax=Hyphodiscus hymeniophilus TaxID=353542 RepID=A0A9P6VGU4_9HELO|nr:cbp3 [Hyphodiscus hymeniophilus]
MASKSCSSCLRILQRQTTPKVQRLFPRPRTPRSFTTAARYHAESDYNVTNIHPSTSIPPVTPERAEGGSKPASTQTSSSALQGLRKRTTETYTAYGATEILYKECAHQADYSIPQARDKDAEMPKTADEEDLGVGVGWWHTEVGLQPTFSTWSQVTMLHMYLLSARFRCFPATSAQPWQQHLLDHFFYDAENKMMIEHNMHARGTRNKYLKDMYVQWRGLLAAYDEGLVRGDAALAAAVWRNVFKANPDVDIRNLAEITSCMRKDLSKLDGMPDEMLMRADWAFSSPKGENTLVESKSQMMDLPFEKASGRDLTGEKGE